MSMRFSQVHWARPAPAQVLSVVPLDEVSRGVVIRVGVMRLWRLLEAVCVGVRGVVEAGDGVVAVVAVAGVVAVVALLVGGGRHTVGVHLVARVQRPGGVQRVAALQSVAVSGLGVGELVVLVEDEDDGDDEDDDDADQDDHGDQHVLALTGADADHAPGLTGHIVIVITRDQEPVLPRTRRSLINLIDWSARRTFYHRLKFLVTGARMFGRVSAPLACWLD